MGCMGGSRRRPQNRMPKPRLIDRNWVHDLVEEPFAEDMHAKRALSLGNRAVGLMHASSGFVKTCSDAP